MQAWIIDANDMDAEDILNFQSNLLHPNPDIRSFLKPENKGTSIVIAPKGFGKTLLLKAKRLSIQDTIAHILPSGSALVDKPSGSPSIIPTTEYGELRDQEGYWRSIWLVSFTIAVLRVASGSSMDGSRALKSILDNENLISVCDIFDHVLSAPVASYHQLNNDYNDVLLPRFRRLHESVAVFIDNIDEYYEGVLREISAKTDRRPSGRIKRSFWHLAQYGIAAAARELNHINTHIKIYVSIRKEVLQGIIGDTHFGQQLRSKSILVSYSHGDLLEIIAKNIANSDTENLAQPQSRNENPIAAFFGPLARVTHPTTGDEEGVLDFWLRHTLGRPRDVAAIGKALSSLPPASRTERRVREVVRLEAKLIAKTYLGEMSPHLEGFDHDLLLPLIDKNVLSADDLKVISSSYAQAYQKAHGTVAAHTDHPFCALFKLGLLGYVGRDPEINDDVQIFRLPGEDPLDNIRVLPVARTYLVHPSLDDLIAERNPRYFESLNDRNVIGRGRRWFRKRVISYVLKGDVKGYSAIMRDGVRNKAFNEVFDAIVSEFGTALDYAQKSQGDSLLLIDANPVKVLTAAQNIQRDLRRSEFRSEIRFAGDAGFVDIAGDTHEKQLYGMAIQNAARLEPHVAPGHIYVTEEFRRRLEEGFGKQLPFGLVTVGPEDLKELETKEGLFNIAKRGGEAEILTAIYRIE
jgi:class 3 adenylate cyclase